MLSMRTTNTGHVTYKTEKKREKMRLRTFGGAAWTLEILSAARQAQQKDEPVVLRPDHCVGKPTVESQNTNQSQTQRSG